MSQNLTVPSLLPETIILESGEMSSAVISYEWALKVLTQDRVRKSHILTFVSTAPETTTFMFGVFSTIRAEALVKWPVNFAAAKESSINLLLTKKPLSFVHFTYLYSRLDPS